MSSQHRSSSASRVAGGILLSRIAGFLRDRAIAHYFGVGPHADVLRTALRGPNILQNLLGEGTISAAFIPFYSRMLEEGREREAGRFAGAIFGLLLALAAGLALLGFVFARPIVAALAPGFLGDAARVATGALPVDRFELAVAAVRIIFPMTGVLVLSAWALGVLNSHRRFFLPYFAPVLWNAAIIAAVLMAGEGLLGFGTGPARDRLLIAACFGALAGGLLQFGVQVPLVASLMRGFRLSLSTRIEGVREALCAFGPVVAGRGVYQLSAYLDLLLASLLATGAIAALGWAQTLYVLPVSLFGLSVAAAELPELSRHQGEGLHAGFAGRLSGSLRQMMFLTVPTCVGYLLFGYLLVGALYRTGEFSVTDNWLVYLVLCGYSAGLLATTCSRLLQNAFYALRDTRTPARIAVARVAISAGVAVPLMFWLDRFPVSAVARQAAVESNLFLGAAGLALASAVGAWVELLLLNARLGGRLEGFAVPRGALLRMAGVALLAALPAGLLWKLLPAMHVALSAALVVGLFAAGYLALARLLGLSEMDAWLGWLRRGK
ncbi:MAG: murein biosynthesis integral membrane protein MurJ [Acidobacteriota bacterium]